MFRLSLVLGMLVVLWKCMLLLLLLVMVKIFLVKVD